MEFEDEGFSVGTSRGSKAWSWKALSTFMESPNFFHLYFDSRSFFLLPKDVFHSSDELQQARLLMREKIQKK